MTYQVTQPLRPEDLAELQRAYRLLESDGIAAKVQNVIGKPLAEGMKRMPENWKGTLDAATNKALRKALQITMKSFRETETRPASLRFHKALAAGSGFAGGAFGFAALPVELPLSTVIMLRSIADIARSEGEDISILESRLACLEVFALGGKSKEGGYADTGYYAVRSLLAAQINEVVKIVSGKMGGGSMLINPVSHLLSSIAARFGAVVSEKTVAQAVPILGAAGGAIINTIFIDHFQNLARGHFIVRRLERQYGKAAVESAYRAVDANQSV